LILLAGAGLMAQSFLRMRHVELGFRPAGLVTMTVDLPPTTYRSATAMHAFNQAMLERLAHMPGATSAAAVNYSPLGTSLIRGDFQLEGGRKPPRDYVVAKLVVTPGYFPTMGIRLLAGREFAAGDAASAPGVVIVSKLVADRIWPGESAVGKRVSMRDRPGPGDWLTVIGVVDDVTQKRLDENREPAMYQPTLQTSQAFFLNHMSFVVRATGDPRSLIPAMRRALKEVDANQAISSIRTMDDTILETVAEPLFQARLIGAFSVFALLLAGIGIYGVIAYSVAERTHEIGIRVALGAGRGNVVRLVHSGSPNLTYDGLNLDAGGGTPTGAVFENGGGANNSFRNGSIGNVVDQKAALVDGSNFTFDNVRFHDAVLRTDGVHMECLYAIVVPGMTIRNSSFSNCAVMDILFTYGDWWSPLPPPYGNVTLDSNQFGPTYNNTGGRMYYTVYVGTRASHPTTVRTRARATSTAGPSATIASTCR